MLSAKGRGFLLVMIVVRKAYVILMYSCFIIAFAMMNE